MSNYMLEPADLGNLGHQLQDNLATIQAGLNSVAADTETTVSTAMIGPFGDAAYNKVNGEFVPQATNFVERLSGTAEGVIQFSSHAQDQIEESMSAANNVPEIVIPA